MTTDYGWSCRLEFPFLRRLAPAEAQAVRRMRCAVRTTATVNCTLLFDEYWDPIADLHRWCRRGWMRPCWPQSLSPQLKAHLAFTCLVWAVRVSQLSAVMLGESARNLFWRRFYFVWKAFLDDVIPCICWIWSLWCKIVWTWSYNSSSVKITLPEL